MLSDRMFFHRKLLRPRYPVHCQESNQSQTQASFYPAYLTSLPPSKGYKAKSVQSWTTQVYLPGRLAVRAYACLAERRYENWEALWSMPKHVCLLRHSIKDKSQLKSYLTIQN